MRQTKIVATIGPACDTPEIIKLLVEAGMNVARFNFSHGTHQEHGARMQAVRQAARELGRPVALLLDTKGPEIRLGELEGGRVALEAGQEIVLTVEQVTGNSRVLPVNYQGLPADVSPGTTILIDDGLVTLEVLRSEPPEVVCRVLNSGVISNHKSLNIPGIEVNLPAVTEEDVADIRFGLQQGIDFIAGSFTRRASDVLDLLRVVEAEALDVQIIAKIENRAGVDNIDEILAVADGVMVARGDLGVEIPAEEVPLVQKAIIAKANQKGKPVITATQMLESMVYNLRPTRAEASDVANAILDGSDAIMLSGETAAGKYPVEAVQTMDRIARKVEEELRRRQRVEKRTEHQITITDAISHATRSIARDLQAAAIITPTASGSTARMISKYRPGMPIIGATPRETVYRQLTLIWGVHPLLVPLADGTDEVINASVGAALMANLIHCGDLLVITAGVPVGIPGTTNLIKVHIVGEVLARGSGLVRKIAVGKVCLVNTPEEALDRMVPGAILVAPGTDRDYVPAMERAAAIITVAGGLTSHAAIVGLNLGIPVVVGVEGAMKSLTDGSLVTVDGQRGLIYKGVTRVL